MTVARAGAHGGFGKRSGETGRKQSRNRAPGLLSDGNGGSDPPGPGKPDCGGAVSMIA